MPNLCFAKFLEIIMEGFAPSPKYVAAILFAEISDVIFCFYFLLFVYVFRSLFSVRVDGFALGAVLHRLNSMSCAATHCMYILAESILRASYCAMLMIMTSNIFSKPGFKFMLALVARIGRTHILNVLTIHARVFASFRRFAFIE